MPKDNANNDSTEIDLDLSSCDNEPIHLIGSIQPSGFLLALSPDWIVERISANFAAFMHVESADLLGKNFSSFILPDAVHAIRNRLAALHGDDTIERAFSITLLAAGPLFDLAIHRNDGLIFIEAELSEEAGELNSGAMVRSMMEHVQDRNDVASLTREAVRLIQALTGYDRVMIYRFHPDQTGEVIAERCRPSMEPFLGLRYPATDIPAQARALLLRNSVRILVDRDAQASPLLATKSYANRPADLSLSVLRTHSPIHLEYLHNMGVAATMTISLVKNNKLWGLIACHHNSPRRIGFERTTTADLFAQILALLIDRCERGELLAYEAATSKITSNLLASVARDGIHSQDLPDLASQLTDIVPCDGTVFCIDGKVTFKGSTPSNEEFEALRAFLDTVSASKLYSTDQISRAFPGAESFSDRAAGMLAIPISTIPRDYLVYFRKSVESSVLWAGDPHKAVTISSDNIERMSPRKSFKAWQEKITGKCSPWTAPELRAAEAVQVTVLEVVLRLISSTEAERKAANQTQELLIAELNHRVRNILGLIRGLISQSRINATDIDTFALVLGDRIHALARAHDQITSKNWGPGSLQTLISTEAEAYLGTASNTIKMSGPPVLLIPQAFSTMALVFHELITNAAKYGAFTGKGGHVDVSWHIGQNDQLDIIWTEIGGPSVKVPTRRGFGSTIIEQSIPHELGGTSQIEYPASGVVVKIAVPKQFVVLENLQTVMTTIPITKPVVGRLNGNVLLVEDNLIIALDAEAMLLSLGAERVLVASSVSDALTILQRERPTFALLDVNLGSQNSFPIADRLFADGVDFIFATGYGSGVNYPPYQSKRPFITKPYTQDTIARAISELSTHNSQTGPS